jgi:hypothetical protein
MTTITPGRDAAVKAIARLEEIVATSEAKGGAVAVRGRLTKEIVKATVLAVTDEADRGIDSPTLMVGLEIAFSNAIASACSTMAKRMKADRMELTAVFLDHLIKRTIERADTDPAISETVRPAPINPTVQ